MELRGTQRAGAPGPEESSVRSEGTLFLRIGLYLQETGTLLAPCPHMAPGRRPQCRRVPAPTVRGAPCSFSTCNVA